jgi:hypothetical protein
MTSAKEPGFDRLRRRDAGDSQAGSEAVPDQQGKRALFSAVDSSPAFGSVTISCSRCGERSVVSPVQAAKLAVPSLHLPLLRSAPWSWMKCPACSRRSWVSLDLTL